MPETLGLVNLLTTSCEVSVCGEIVRLRAAVQTQCEEFVALSTTKVPAQVENIHYSFVLHVI